MEFVFILPDVFFPLGTDFIWAHEKGFTTETKTVEAANKSEKP